MGLFENKAQCSGCTACAHACPSQAIAMVLDSEGFYYPEIDSTNCTDCGLCSAICPFRNQQAKEDRLQYPIVFAAKHKNELTRLSSSSGGMFSAISDYIINNGGIIYGAAFDDAFNVCHQKAQSIVEINKMKGSKYVQSDLGTIFLDVKKELETNRDILFTGTPCQIAGLKAYLGKKKYEKLILCDLVCHGTPSPLIWKDYVDFLKQKKGDLRQFNFRDKRKGWHESLRSATFADGAVICNTPLIDVFFSIYAELTVLRPACHVCPFACLERVSDLTIADFWGIEKCKPHFDDNKGVSLVLLNTKKGVLIFDKIKDQLIYEESNVNECKQHNLTRPTEPSPQRDIFWKDYYKNGFEYIAKKYTDYGFINRLKHSNSILKTIFKEILSMFGLLHFAKSIIHPNTKPR